MKTSGILTAAVAALLMSATPVHATSCRRLSDHYLLICERAGCQPLFRAFEVPGYSGCRHTMTIAPFPEWAKMPLLDVVEAATEPPERPIVTSVQMEQRYPRVPATAGEFTNALSGWAEPHVVQHAEGKDVVVAWYQRRCAADIHRDRMLILKDGLLGGSALALIVGMFVWLVLGFRRRDVNAHAGMLARVLAIKFSLILLDMGLSFFRGWPSPILLLVIPVAVVFVFLEVALYVLGWWLWGAPRSSLKAAEQAVAADDPAAVKSE